MVMSFRGFAIASKCPPEIEARLWNLLRGCPRLAMRLPGPQKLLGSFDAKDRGSLPLAKNPRRLILHLREVLDNIKILELLSSRQVNSIQPNSKDKSPAVDA